MCLVHFLQDVAHIVGINNRLALELCSKLKAYVQTVLRDKSTKAETEVRTEVLNLYAAVYECCTRELARNVHLIRIIASVAVALIEGQ